MNSKTVVWIGALIGSTIASFIPILWGDSVFSFSSIILGSIGAIIGIYFGYKLSNK